MFVLDTETYLIGPGLLAPPLVCLQVAQDDGPVRVFVMGVDEVRNVVEGILRSDELIVGHNIAFDLLVIGRQYPDLMPLIFDAYANDRITDTMVREKLKLIANGRFFQLRGKGFSLATLAARYGDKKDANDPWRLRYSELWGIPFTAWPEAARQYAAHDVESTRHVFLKQGKSPISPDEYRQARAAWTMHLIGAAGVRTDYEQIKAFEKSERELYEKDKAVLIEKGLVRPGGRRNLQAARDRMDEVCKAKNIKTPTTKKGYTSLDEDACEATGDEILMAYQRYGSRKNLLTRIQALYAGVDAPINPSFDSLMETGRTSCRKPSKGSPVNGYQIQNMRRAVGERECFVPAKGNVFLASDYDTLELCTLSQVCLWMLGESELAKVLIAGGDPHLALGAELLDIPYDEALAIYKDLNHPRRKEVKEARQISKVANFGFPGGMAAGTFCDYARGYGIEISSVFAESLQDRWFGRWREMGGYFDRIRNDLPWREVVRDGKDYKLTTITQWASKRVRADVLYTVACNSFFQGLAADLAKAAGFALVMACEIGELRGWKVWNFIHDEYILEGPEEDAARAAQVVERIMCEEGQKWCPDVPIKASPALMRRWRKEAEPVFDASGTLIPWEDRPDAAGA